MVMVMMTVMMTMMNDSLCGGRPAATGKRLRHLGINLEHEFCTIIPIYDDHDDDCMMIDDYIGNEDNDGDNHDNHSHDYVFANTMMLINSIAWYQEVQSKKDPGGII